jgi:AcrR family transcriptional regulator
MFTQKRTRQDGKEATRARILDVARARLESLGFDGTSIRDVAEAAGVAAGTVLLHFPDKRDLLHAAFFDDLERTWVTARDGRAAKGLERELSRLAAAFFAYYAARPALSRALLRESLFAEPPWSTRFAAQVADVHQHVASLAAAAKARDELDATVDPEALAAAFFAFYYFALLAWLQGGHPEPLRMFERMLHEHLAGRGPAVARRPSVPAPAALRKKGKNR